MSDIITKLLSSGSSKPHGQPVYGSPYGSQYGGQQPQYPPQQQNFLPQQHFPPQQQQQFLPQQQPYGQPPGYAHHASYHHPQPPQPPQQHFQPSSNPPVFNVRPSPQKTKSETSVVHPMGYPIEAPPMYSIESHEYSKPNVILFRGDPTNPANKIADARFHSFSSTTDLTLRGQPIYMKQSSMSGHYSFECPGLGSFKWKKSDSSGMNLVDASGKKVAKIKTTAFFKREKELRFLVPVNEQLVELALISATAAKILNRAALEAVGEVVGAVAGA